MEKENNILNSNSMDLFGILKKYKLHFGVFLLIVIVITVVVYIFTPKVFKSTAVLYPTASGSLSQELLTETSSQKKLLVLGDEENVEQLMQIASSEEIKNKIINKFDLFNHYKIDKNTKYPRTKLTKKYENNIKIKKTENMAVEIDVFDQSPDTAALIAQQIVFYIDTLFHDFMRDRATKAFQLVEKELVNTKKNLEQIGDTLKKLGLLGIIDVRFQTEMYTEQYAIALSNGNHNAINELNKRLEVLSKYGSTYNLFSESMLEAVKRVSTLETKYQEAKLDMEQDLPHTYLISAPAVPEYKDSPKLLYMLIISLISGFVLAFIILLFFDQYKKK